MDRVNSGLELMPPAKSKVLWVFSSLFPAIHLLQEKGAKKKIVSQFSIVNLELETRPDDKENDCVPGLESAQAQSPGWLQWPRQYFTAFARFNHICHCPEGMREGVFVLHHCLQILGHFVLWSRCPASFRAHQEP